MTKYPECTCENDYRNWYALSTISGSEQKIKKSIENLFKDRFNLYLPCRELLHTTNGRSHKVIMPMFPGYLFIYKEVEEFFSEIRHSCLNHHVHPILYGFRFVAVRAHEMEFLMKLTGPEGLVKITECVMDENEMVKIVRGPLKDLTGRILFINKRKKKAKIRIELLNRDVEVSLGFEIL